MHRRRQQFNYWTSTIYDIARGDRSPSIYAIGYVRSGTNWICNLLSAYTGLPVNEPWKYRFPPLSPRIFHLHRFLPFQTVRNRSIYIMRDGRDTFISRYFHLLRQPVQKAAAEKYLGREMTPDNMSENLTGFIRFLTTYSGSAPDWREHIRNWSRHDFITVKYEELSQDPEGTLARALQQLAGEPPDMERVRAAVEANRFSKLTARKPGQEDSTNYFRKGVVGDWRNHFTKTDARVFDEYAGDELVLAGYEQDRSWVHRLEDDGGIPMAEVTVYYKSWCPYCRRAFALLDRKGVPYEKVDVESAPDREEEMVRRSGGAATVPQIFVGDRHVGGSDDLHTLDDDGRLDALLGI
jgi:glutaredoxin 3